MGPTTDLRSSAARARVGLLKTVRTSAGVGAGVEDYREGYTREGSGLSRLAVSRGGDGPAGARDAAGIGRRYGRSVESVTGHERGSDCSFERSRSHLTLTF